MIIGGLQPAVVETESLADPILEVKLAIIMRRKVPGREPACLGRVEPGAIEEIAGRAGHEAGVSAAPPSRMKRRSQ